MELQDKTPEGRVLLTRADLVALGITVCNSTLGRWIQYGRFPRPLRLSGTTLAWLSSEIQDWLDKRIADRDRHHGAWRD
jgi:predicted DNA-binding transcriptional regulator AlpA